MPDAAHNFRIILASASPRRRELLAQAGYAFEVEAADIDETLHPNEPAAGYVRRLAEEKAQGIFRLHSAPNSGAPSATESSTASSSWVGSTSSPLLVLGADTTVVCDNQILAKPAGPEDARRMLRQLSNRVHQVLTGVALATRAGIVSGVEITEVTFSDIPEHELDAYCATAEPMDKAGAYGIQGYAARWIPRIDGDYFNVMGLPIARVVRMIEATVEAMNR